MIRINQQPIPAFLRNNANRWTQILLQAIAAKGGDVSKVPANYWNKYRKPYIKRALEHDFLGKCAYCESKVTHVAYQHIEHYKPKKKFPRSTFEWRNLLLSCPICNGVEYKGDNFPLDDDGNPMLINPYTDYPFEHIRFIAGRAIGISTRGQATVQLIGLFRDGLYERRLQLHRRIHYYFRSIIKNILNDEQDLLQEGLDLIAECLEPPSEYLELARELIIALAIDSLGQCLEDPLFELVMRKYSHLSEQDFTRVSAEIEQVLLDFREADQHQYQMVRICVDLIESIVKLDEQYIDLILEIKTRPNLWIEAAPRV
jgi:hypothetical protein